MGSDASGWFWEDLVTAEKEAVTDVWFWNETLNTDVLLTLYKYDVDTMVSCCSLDVEAADHFVSIRSIFLNDLGETEDEGCYFGWTASLEGDNTLWAGDFDGIPPYPLPDSDDNLAFCLTGELYDPCSPDETPPLVELFGADSVVVECGTAYTDAGATAVDMCDGDLTGAIVTTDPVDTTVPGDYSIVYNVTDAAGNAAEPAIRTVHVVDTLKPTLTLLGEPLVYIECPGSYIEAGAVAVDSCDGDITASIVISGDTVDPAWPGTYTVRYNVSDSSGNAAPEVIRTINITDTRPPVITMLGEDFITVECGDVYMDVGATAMDACDGDVSSDIIPVNYVDTGIPAVFTVNYYAMDHRGNYADVAFRTVTVVDTTAPVIVACTPPRPLTPGEDGGVVLPDLTGNIVVEDVCGTLMYTQDPSAGTIVFEDTLVTMTVTDRGGNVDVCEMMVSVGDSGEEGEGESGGPEYYECPETGTLFGQPAARPSSTSGLAYYLSDEALWTTLEPLPAEDFQAAGRICDVHWWGVEVDAQGLACERSENSFVIQVASDASGVLGEYVATPDRQAVATELFWNDTLNSNVLLTLYQYDVNDLEECCFLDPGADNHFISIRSVYFDGIGALQDEGRYFGWVTTPGGDNDLWAWPRGSALPSPLSQVADNLAFCLTGDDTAEEGESEGETPCGEVLPYFICSPRQGDPPLYVTFTNYTSGHAGWSWDFGDGAQRGEWSPVHLYAQPGTYTVTLTAWDPCEASRTYRTTINVYGEIAEGEGEVPAEGEGETPVEGEGEALAEGEGETPVEGEGEVPAEGEGEALAEGEGETPVEGEGEVPAEGEGETQVEGEGEVPIEGEGETPVEGEGEVPAEGEGETPVEGEGETSVEGEGEALAEGEGETPVEGEGEVPAEGEGETPVEGEGETSVEGEGEVPAEGEGELPVEGEGEVPAEGEIPVEGEGEVPIEGEGETPVEGEGEIIVEGEVPIEGEGEIPAEGEGEIPAEGEGEVPVEGEGETPVEGEGEVSPEGEGEIPAEGEGEVLPEGEGAISTEGEGELPVEGEGEVPAEGEAVEGEGETPVEGEGEAVEGEGESEEEPTCCERYDWSEPANLFFGALALLVLLVSSIFLATGDI